MHDKHRFDNVIYKYQKRSSDPDPKSIHAELLFWDGAMYSSSGRGGLFAGHGLWPGVGTRFIKYSDIEPHKWRFHNLDITEQEEDRIRFNCEDQKSMRYDWLGIIGQPLPFNVQSPWAAYCSEKCNDEICKVVKRIMHKRKMRPSEIVKWYKAEGLILPVE